MHQTAQGVANLRIHDFSKTFSKFCQLSEHVNSFSVSTLVQKLQVEM